MDHDLLPATDVVARLERVAEAVDRRAGRPGHSAAVARCARELAAAVGLGAAAQEQVALAGLVHDVAALNRAPAPDDGPGARALRALLPAAVVDLVGAHGERWDGTGLPGGLAGGAIPLGARVLAVADAHAALADAHDELAGTPPGTRAAVDADAERELTRRAGTALDPAVVAVLTGLLHRGSAGPGRARHAAL